MQFMCGPVLDIASVTIYVVTIKVGNSILLTIVNKVQMVQRRIVPSCPVIVIIPVLTSLFLEIKPRINGFILAADLCVTGANFHNSFFIVGFTIIFASGFACIILTSNRFKPNMISPVIVTAWETDHHIVAICIICRAKDILIHNCDDTLDGA